jgi:hypothetical protein
MTIHQQIKKDQWQALLKKLLKFQVIFKSFKSPAVYVKTKAYLLNHSILVVIRNHFSLGHCFTTHKFEVDWVVSVTTLSRNIFLRQSLGPQKPLLIYLVHSVLDFMSYRYILE